MLKKILNHRLVLVIVIFVLVVASGLFIYSQKTKDERLVVSGRGVEISENVVPGWVKYTHPSLGYTIEYPKNILPQMRLGDSLFDMYFYKDTPAGNPIFFISLQNSRTLSIPERNKLFPSEITKKTTISGVDAYIITDNKYPNNLSVELDKGGMFYSIGFVGLPPAIIDHIINSFHIDFVPKNL